MCCLTQLKRWGVTLHMWFDSGTHEVPSRSACPPSLSLPHLQGCFWYQIAYDNCKKHQAFILWGISPAGKRSPLFFLQQTRPNRASLVAHMAKNLPVMQGTRVWSLGWEDPLEKGDGYPLQYSCLENTMDRGARWATVLWVSQVGHDWATKHIYTETKHKCILLVLIGLFPILRACDTR